MTVKVYQRVGLDTRRLVGIWEQGEGFVRAVDGLRFADDEMFAEYTPEMMVDEFDGPTYFAVPEGSDGETQKSLSSFGSDKMASEGSAERQYVPRVSAAPDDVIVHVDDDDKLYYEL